MRQRSAPNVRRRPRIIIREQDVQSRNSRRAERSEERGLLEVHRDSVVRWKFVGQVKSSLASREHMEGAGACYIASAETRRG